MMSLVASYLSPYEDAPGAGHQWTLTTTTSTPPNKDAGMMSRSSLGTMKAEPYRAFSNEEYNAPAWVALIISVHE